MSVCIDYKMHTVLKTILLHLLEKSGYICQQQHPIRCAIKLLRPESVMEQYSALARTKTEATQLHFNPDQPQQAVRSKTASIWFGSNLRKALNFPITRML